MKRILLSLVLVLGLTVALAPVAKAETEGCPDTWRVNSIINAGSKELMAAHIAGYQELMAAKQRLGGDMVIEQLYWSYTDYSGELGPLPKPRHNLDINDVYLYGNTKITTKYRVQVKNCPGATEFNFKLGTLKGDRSIALDVDSKKWASDNQSAFVDFVQANNFSQCLAYNIKALQTPGKSGGSHTSGRLQFTYTSTRSCGTPLLLIEKTPSCKEIISGSPSNRISITLGSKCVFAYGSWMENSIEIFENFTIDSNQWKISITCVKGASKKIVQGWKGYEFKMKCPAGYKKK